MAMACLLKIALGMGQGKYFECRTTISRSHPSKIAKGGAASDRACAAWVLAEGSRVWARRADRAGGKSTCPLWAGYVEESL